MRRFVAAALPIVVLACTPARDARDAPASHGALDLDDCDPKQGVLCGAPPTAATESSSAPSLPAPQPPFCARLAGKGIVGSGGGVSPTASTEAECKKCNGSWGPHGMVGVVGCLCATPDGGRACSSPRDCASECIVADVDAQQLVPRCPILGAKLPGTCANDYVMFGCHAYIVEQATPSGPLRQVWRVCRD